MTEAKGLTLKEIADGLEIDENAAHVRIHRAGIKALFKGAIYPLDTIELLQGVKQGRPRKAPPEGEAHEPGPGSEA